MRVDVITGTPYLTLWHTITTFQENKEVVVLAMGNECHVNGQ